MRIAFCTTVKGRTPHLKITLPRNLADNADYADLVFVILNYSTNDDLVEWLHAEHQTELDSGRIVLYTLPNEPRFRMAHAKNVSSRCGLLEGADIIANIDADNFTCAGFASHISQTIKSQWDYLAIGQIIKGVTPRGVTGRIAMHRHAFLKCGGYDEAFNDWGPDDKCADWRLRRMGYTRHTIPDQFIDAIRHNDKMRFREYPHARKVGYDYAETAVKDATNTVVNFGLVGCGIVYRNADAAPITLKPIPTRIFGIGMHKTGTTSLHHALEILGYDSAHWPSAHWAKKMWSEMHGAGRSAVVEKSHASCDLPVTMLFRELDASYPGSKFVLTLRDEQDWLTSVEHHWNPAFNPYCAQWDNDPFTHKVHTLLYGRRKFDVDVFLARYRRHAAEVIEYFQGRDDLLILRLDDANPWQTLCAFLGVSIPAVGYPKSNVKPSIVKEARP